MEERRQHGIEDLKARKVELQERVLIQSRKMLWFWGVLAVASLVTLVGKSLDFTTDIPIIKRVMIPGVLFIISAVGVSLNRRVVVKARKEAASSEPEEPRDCGE